MTDTYQHSDEGVSPQQLPTLTMEESKRLMAGPFGEQLHRLVVLQMTYLVFGTTGPRGEPQNLQNGTCFFMRTPSRLMAITARHVIEGFKCARNHDPSTICQVGNLILDPIDRLIDQGTRSDIATFDISDHELKKIDKFPITLWPPHPPDMDEKGVLLAGYPAAAITADDPLTRCFGIYAASGVAQRVTDWQLSCAIEWDYVQAPSLGRLPPKNYDTGGMNGGPVLTVRQSGVLSFPLAGVISEGRATTDTIVAERADCIRANGTIRS